MFTVIKKRFLALTAPVVAVTTAMLGLPTPAYAANSLGQTFQNIVNDFKSFPNDIVFFGTIGGAYFVISGFMRLQNARESGEDKKWHAVRIIVGFILFGGVVSMIASGQTTIFGSDQTSNVNSIP